MFRRYKLHLWLPMIMLLASLLITSSLLLAIMIGITYGVLFLRQKQGHRKLVRKISIILLFVLLGALPLLFNAYGSNAATVYWYRWGWQIDSVGVALFVRVVLRCIAAVGAMLLLIDLTPIYLLCGELRQMHCPALFVDLFELTYRYIYVLREKTHQIALAQVSRLGYVGCKARVKDTGLLLAQTIVLSHQEADDLYNGLQSRGYDDGPISTSSPSPEPMLDVPVIELDDVSFAYEQEQYILKNLTLRVGRGERIALLGENGAGKSTLFLLLNGINKHKHGRYLLYGQPVDNSQSTLRKLRKTIAVVFQNSNHQLFNPSVYDEVAYGLKNMGYEADALAQKVDAILETYEISALKNTPPHKLSEGQKKWVAIASVLAVNPDVIVLDEPTSNLDRYYTHRVIALLDTLCQAGKTVLISTHDMNLAYDWAERVVVMHDGQILMDDEPDNVFGCDEVLALANLDKPLLYQPKRKAIGITDDNHYHLPLFLKASCFNILVVGGGAGALRKVQTVLDAGGQCVIVSPTLCPDLQHLIEEHRLTYHARSYAPGDLSGMDMVVAATDNDQCNTDICLEAHKHGLLYASLSDTQRGNFQFAATQHLRGLSFAVHTDYALPEVSSLLKRKMAGVIPSNLDLLLQTLSERRKAYKQPGLSDDERARREEEYMNVKRELEELLNI